MTSQSRPVETLLVDLADHMDWPVPSDLGAQVGRRLAHPPARRRRSRWIAVTATVVVLVASLLLFSPRARQAVADFLGVAGIEIEFEPELEAPIGEGLGLGRPVSLERAVESVDFDVSVPEVLGEPDAVYLSARRVSMVWKGQESLPAAGGTGVGLLYSQFAFGTGGDGFLKAVGPDSVVVPIEVSGSTGFWIEGSPHIINYEDALGIRLEETTRLAGNVLMWEAGGVTHRIETVEGLDDALAFASSIQPVSD